VGHRQDWQTQTPVPPRIPLDRLLDTDVLTGTQKQELIAYRNR